MTPTERKESTAYRNESLKERDYIVSAEEKGIEIGRTEGRTERDMEIALNLLRRNLPLDVISSATGLSHAKLSELKAKL
jgi:predicted transposase/invertase (TIGR01784 family)